MSPQPQTQQLHETQPGTAMLAAGRSRPRKIDRAAMPVPISAAAQAAREVNARIADVAATLPVGAEEASYTFFCECGCLQPVPLTLAGYATVSQALRQGHAAER